MAAENQPVVTEKDVKVLPEINQEKLGAFLDTRKKEEDAFATYSPPETRPTKDNPGWNEYVTNFRFAFNLLIESGMDEKEVKKMQLDDLFSLARERHQTFVKSKEHKPNKNEDSAVINNESVDVVQERSVDEYEEVTVEVSRSDRKEWMKRIGSDLVRVVRPVFKFERDLKTPRKAEDVQTDYLELDNAKKRLGNIYSRIVALSRGAKDKEEAKKIRISIEDACLIVGGERSTGRNGMNLEKAEILLRALKIEIPEPRVEKRKIDGPSESEHNVAQLEEVNYLEIMRDKIDGEILEKLQKLNTELPETERDVLKAIILLATKPELREKHKDFWEKKAMPILVSLGMNVV